MILENMLKELPMCISAEIDYLIAVGSKIVPIEVKAKAIGSLRSLKIFIKEKKIPLGLKISESTYALHNQILSVPFYLVEEIPRLVEELYYTSKI